jgi:energy-coupling factor transporter transmembrane protein EcfT
MADDGERQVRRVHPVVLMVGGIAFTISLLLTRSIAGLVFMVLVCLISTLLLPTRYKELLKGIARFWLLLVLTFVIHALVTNAAGHRMLLDSQGLMTAVFFAIRMLLILAVPLVLGQIHSPQRYGRELGRLLARLPFGNRAFGQIELMATLALRFVPFLTQEFERLKLVMKARGLQPTNSFVNRVRNHGRLLYPLMLSSIRRADHVALALQARGYDPSIRRTYMNMQSFRIGEIACLAVFVAACALIPCL